MGQVARKPLHILECHVKGYTKQCNFIPEYKRGKFLGLCDDFMIKHLKNLNINTLQIMPIFKSKDTYWNYDSLSYMDINTSMGTLEDFKLMLSTLQSNGIKVVLDVVYTHTHNEASIEGVYYTDRDLSGCGNSVDAVKSLPVIKASMDYWLNIIGVDGMRFDLGAILFIEDGVFKREGVFAKTLESYNDKIFIVEPYGCNCYYELGNFPEYIYELNGKFCKAVRKGEPYWCGDDLLWEKSINYIASHDGFCAADIVAYNEKHNWHNLEHNQDGDNDNASYNHGVEGYTDNEDILNKRNKHLYRMFEELYTHSYNWLLLAGDEIGNSQQGCNNNYLIDDERAWVDWSKYSEYFKEK